MIKKILKYLLYLLVAFVIAIFLLPFVFKDKVNGYVKTFIDDQVNASVTFKDIDLTLWNSFPDVRLSLDSLCVVGLDTFDRVPLYSAVKTSVDISIPSLLGKNPKPKINEIFLKKPKIQIVYLANGQSNFDILKSQDTSSSTLNITLQKYSIEDGQIKYIDRGLNFNADLKNVNHSGKGDFSQDIFDLKTVTSIDTTNVIYDGIAYFKNARTTADMDIKVDLPKNRYQFLKSKLKINELDLVGNGDIALMDEDIKIKADFKSGMTTFKSLLSLFPNAYTSDFEKVKASGNASFEGKIEGKYNSIKNVMPSFDISAKVQNGMFQYPGLPIAVTQVQADIHTKAERSDYLDLFVNIPSFQFKLNQGFFDGKLYVSNLSGDQKLDGFVHSKLNLADIFKAFPMPEMERLGGLMSSNLKFKGNMSDIMASNVNKVYFDGNADITNWEYKSKSMPKITAAKISAKASPNALDVDASQFLLGNSDATFHATVNNPLSYFSTQNYPSISINGSSKLIDLNQWKSQNSSAPSNLAEPPSTISKESTKDANLKIKYIADKVIYDAHELKNVEVNGVISENAIEIDRLGAKMNDSDLTIHGKINGLYDYFISNQILDGDIYLKSKKFDINPFLSTNTATSENTQTILVPERLRMIVHTDIDDLQYTNLNLKQTKGDIVIYDQEAKLVDMSTNMLGGKVSLEGLYNTRSGGNPDFKVKLDLARISFLQALNNLETFKKLVPVAKYINGHFNTTLVMDGKMGSNMVPLLSSLNASGFLETITGALKGYKPIADMADKLGVSQLKEIDFTNTKNWFEIIQGTVDVKEYKRSWDGIEMTIAGNHRFEKGMDFNFDFVIPKEKVKATKAGKAAVSGHDFLQAEAIKYGIKIDNGPNYYINVSLKGSLTNPIIKITPKTSTGSTIKDVVKTKVNETVNTAKDSIQKVIRKKEDQLRDTITKRANQEVEKAKTKAQNAIDKAVDSLKNKAKDKAIDKLDSLTKNVISDSTRQKAKDILDKKTTQEVEKIKDKIKDFNPFKKGSGRKNN
jgi:hypothetical protein